MAKNQFLLLTTRRFLPLFVTQFLGAFNDNVFKNAMVILIAFQLTQQPLSSNTLVNLAAGFFILPFFIFSATFGQFSEKYEKSRIVRYVKLLEIGVMLFASLALYLNNVWLLLFVLFLLGTQSTLFGPAKYSILPQQLATSELTGGNALIETSTFIAILTGTILGGILIALDFHGREYVIITVLSVAVAGFVSSLFIPKAPATKPGLSVNWNLFTATRDMLRLARKSRPIFLSILGISWFWFYGSLFFYQVGNYTKFVIGGGPHITTLLITTFALGIGVGSLLCEKLSRQHIELGLVPFGAIGLTVFSFVIFFLEPHVSTSTQSFLVFLSHGHNVALLICLFLLAVFAGFYNVPLYAYIQYRSAPEERSRIIAANNIVNALFMVFSALFAIALLALGMTIPHLFLVASILNIGLSIFIFFHMPEFIMRFLICFLGYTMFRIKTKGEENLPAYGPVIIACNHVSFVDVVIMSAVSKSPIFFMMDFRLYNTPILRIIARMGKAIPTAMKHEDETIKNRAYYRAIEALNNGEIVGLFPEGYITRDGKLGEFKHGITKLVQQSHATVIPMAVQGLWGSIFSRKKSGLLSHLAHCGRRRVVGLNIGKPIPAEAFSLEKLKENIQALLDDQISSK